MPAGTIFHFGICAVNNALTLSRRDIYRCWGLPLYVDGIGLYGLNIRLRHKALLVIASWIDDLSEQLGMPVTLG